MLNNSVFQSLSTFPKKLENDPNKQEQIVKDLLTAKSDEFSTPATRPTQSTLTCEKFEKTFDFKIPNWRFVLGLAMNN